MRLRRAFALLALLALLPARPAAAAEARAKGPLLAALCYHRFGAETRLDPYRISLERLDAQLGWLQREGWQGVSLTQVAAALSGDAGALPAKGVLLSVDDGYKAGALGAAVFERHGFRAVYFVYPSMLGHGAFLGWKDLKALEARGHSVACHTLTHPNLAKVAEGEGPDAYAARVREELLQSKTELEQGLGHPVDALAWPYGGYNPALSDAATRAGYRQQWSVSGGLNDGSALDPQRLRRILLMGHPSLAAFARHLSAEPLAEGPRGLREGGLIYRSELPLDIGIPAGVEADLGKGVLRATAGPQGPSLRLEADLPNGFHYLTLARREGPLLRRTPYLFQVAPDAWKPDFEALSPAPDAKP